MGRVRSGLRRGTVVSNRARPSRCVAISSMHMMMRRPMRFIRDVIGSCLIAPTVTHAGITKVKRYSFDMP